MNLHPGSRGVLSLGLFVLTLAPAGSVRAAAPAENADDRPRPIKFVTELAGGDAGSVVTVTPSVQGDSIERAVNKDDGTSGSWDLRGAGESTVSLALAGAYYLDGGNIVRGALARAPYEISGSSLNHTIPVAPPCAGDCEAEVRYTTEATGSTKLTFWAGVYSVDPSDPQQQAVDGAENGGRRADAESQGQRRSGREARTLSQEPQTEAEIADELHEASLAGSTLA